MQANLRNIVTKVSTGGTLTTAECEMIEQGNATGQLPVDLERMRDAAIIRLYCKGKNLTEEQLARISRYLPSNGNTAARRMTAELYKKKRKDYIAIYQRSERVLKGWVAHGRYSDVEKKIPRDPPDFPPFDEPTEMEAWWRRCMSQEPPQNLKDLADGSTASPDEEKTAATTTEDGKQPADQEPNYMPDITGVLDEESDAHIQFLKRMCQAHMREMESAQKAGEVTRYRNARNRLSEDREELRKWQKDITNIMEKNGEMLRTKVMNQVLVAIFGVAAQSFTNALFAIVRQLAPQLPVAQARELVLPHRDRVIGHIKKTRFSQAWEEAKLEILPPAA